MKPHYLEQPLDDMAKKAALCMIADMSSKLAVDVVFRSKSSSDIYVRQVRNHTRTNTKHGAVAYVILFGLVPFSEIVEAIPEDLRPLIKIKPI